MRILLVEDDPMIADAVKAALSDEAHAVHLVTNGRNALAQLSVNTFQLVLLDLGLPSVELGPRARAKERRFPRDSVMRLNVAERCLKTNHG